MSIDFPHHSCFKILEITRLWLVISRFLKHSWCGKPNTHISSSQYSLNVKEGFSSSLASFWLMMSQTLPFWCYYFYCPLKYWMAERIPESLLMPRKDFCLVWSLLVDDVRKITILMLFLLPTVKYWKAEQSSECMPMSRKDTGCIDMKTHILSLCER